MSQKTDVHSHDKETQERDNPDYDGTNRSTDLRDSPMMARLLDALEQRVDIGHYGQFTFATVARHFMKEQEILDLLAQQPDMDEERARALLLQVQQHHYSPPRRERILEQQRQQEFQIIDPDDPDSGNLYRELRFPDEIYDNINHYYEDKAEATEHSTRQE